MRSVPRAHQENAIAELRERLRAGARRVMVQAPTGSGKTILAAMIVEGALRKLKRVLFVVPALSLVDQTVAAFEAEGIHAIGVMQGLHERTDVWMPVQVASVQTLMRRKMPIADVVIIDEAHVVFDFYRKWFADPAWADVPIVGLSATPWPKGLGKLYRQLIVATTTRELIEAGFLAPFRVFAAAHPDLSKVRTLAGDYHEGDLASVMNDKSLVADVVGTWRRLGEGRPTLCFAVDRAHAKALQVEFENAGISTGYIDAFSDRVEREEVRRRFHAGEIKVVTNVGCLTTGVDWDVRCIILARPTKSEMLFVQIVGRGLRTAPGKHDCLVLDHSDTTLRLGFVTDIHHEELDDGSSRPGKRVRKMAEPKECPSCTFLKPAKVHICPECGFAPEKKSEIECREGELVEVGRVASERYDRQVKQRWYSMLLGIEKARGYKTGWASRTYRDKFKVWPRSLFDATLPADDEVKRFVQSRFIARAKARSKPPPRTAPDRFSSTRPSAGFFHGR